MKFAYKILVVILMFLLMGYNPYDKRYEIKRKLMQDVSDSFITGKNLNLKKYDDELVCIGATPNNALEDFQGKLRTKWDKDSVFYEEAKRRGLKCGVNEKSINIVSKPKTKTYTQPKSTNLKSFYASWDNEKLCIYATDDYQSKWGAGKLIIKEAKRRGLECVNNEKKSNSILNLDKNNLGAVVQRAIENQKISDKSNFELCNYATKNKKWDYYYAPYVEEAKRRGLDCGVEKSPKSLTENDSKDFVYSLPDRRLCNNLKLYDNYKNSFTSQMTLFQTFLQEAKRRGLDCGIKDNNKTIIASKPETKTYIQSKPAITSDELDAANKRARELEQELVKLKSKQKREQQRINSDNQEPIINAFSKPNGSNTIISGRVTDNIEIAEVLINGQVQKLNSNGTFETKFYVPRSGKVIEIVAYDFKGNKASKILKLERGEIQSADKQQFKNLDPSLRRVKSNPNALALIIGISDYENTKASALYADSDAKMFYDYANLKLGIPSSNIKELVNDNADRIDITRAIKSWLLKRTVTDKTDLYVFFAGHGLATDDGKDVYLLPYDGVPDLLEDSAIKRKELFEDIQATKPRSVTVFLDTCYSGGTRNEKETLVASLRPIIITPKKQTIPDNFTVLSAAQGNQTSQSLEEVKHGLFSYYTMLGMEGGADANNDKKITASELHAFIKDKVERQSQFRQTPELQGDKDRVLVEFN